MSALGIYCGPSDAQPGRFPDGSALEIGHIWEPTALKGKAHRPGLYQCNDCRQQFTVTVGTLFERSKIPLSKWLMATYLLSASKKGMSTRSNCLPILSW